MAVLPTPMISTFSPIESSVAEGDGLQPVDADVNAIGIVTAGNVEFLAARRAAADEDRVEAFGQQRLHALDGRVVADLDAHVEDLVDLVRQHALGQAERRDVGAHQAAGLVVLFEHDDFVAERHQVVRDGERGRPRADAARCACRFSWLGILGRRSVMSPRRSAATRLRRQMATGLPSTRPRRQAGSQGRSQVRPRIAGEHVRLPVEHVGVGVTALRDQADVLGNVGVGRTGPLAIDNFVEVVRVADVRGVHTWILSISTTVNV